MIILGCALGVIAGYGVLYIFGRAIEYGKKNGIVKTDGQK